MASGSTDIESGKQQVRQLRAWATGTSVLVLHTHLSTQSRGHAEICESVALWLKAEVQPACDTTLSCAAGEQTKQHGDTLREHTQGDAVREQKPLRLTKRCDGDYNDSESRPSGYSWGVQGTILQR